MESKQQGLYPDLLELTTSREKKESRTERPITPPPAHAPTTPHSTSSLMVTSQLQVYYEFLNIFIIFYAEITIPCPCPWRDLIDFLQ